MNLPTLQKNWDLLASSDPLWAILTDPAKKNSRWGLDEFFHTGTWEVQMALEQAERKLPLRRGRALDFGCGVGRLTQALGPQFEEVCGVDIAPTMLDLAQRYNPHGDRCRFYLNSGTDLSQFPDKHFDFIYSSITLQHMEPRYSLGYIREFVRVLAPGGAALFQLTSKALVGRIAGFLSQRVFGARLSQHVHSGRPVIGMHGVAKREVIRILRRAGGTILEVSPDQSAGPDWQSYKYLVTRV